MILPFYIIAAVEPTDGVGSAALSFRLMVADNAVAGRFPHASPHRAQGMPFKRRMTPGIADQRFRSIAAYSRRWAQLKHLFYRLAQYA